MRLRTLIKTDQPDIYDHTYSFDVIWEEQPLAYPTRRNIRVHSRKERRYRCITCGRTFAATHDTPFYRLKKPTELVLIVLTLLCHGCPLQAIVAAFGLDERTIAAWRTRAGRHGQQFHEHHVLGGQVQLGHVQADELYIKAVVRRFWMALAMAVPSRLWLGGSIVIKNGEELRFK